MSNQVLPEISIIVPVYNPPEKYLRECLDSLIGQSLKNIEIILIDNASIGAARKSYRNTPPGTNVSNSSVLKKTKGSRELVTKA